MTGHSLWYIPGRSCHFMFKSVSYVPYVVYIWAIIYFQFMTYLVSRSEPFLPNAPFSTYAGISFPPLYKTV